MIKALAIVSLLSISLPFVASAAEETSCILYNPPNSRLEMVRVSQTDQYAINGFSVELKGDRGCTESCWDRREILVTRNGVTVSTTADTKTLILEDGTLLYPTLRFLENGNQYSVQCMTSGK